MPAPETSGARAAWRFTAACLALALAAGCDWMVGADFDGARPRTPADGAAGGGGSQRDATPDVGSDVSVQPDAAGAGGFDAGPEASPDVAADVWSDMNVKPDAAGAGGGDAGHDASPDVAVDSGPDSRDAEPDANDASDANDAGPIQPVLGLSTLHPTYIAVDSRVRAAVVQLGANAIAFDIPWSDFFYTSDPTCSATLCPICRADGPCQLRQASIPECRQLGLTELECWVGGALNWWIGTGPIGPVSVLITLRLHHNGLNDWRVGPSHVVAKQIDPADMNSSGVLGPYREFYDRIAPILSHPFYETYVRDWTFSVGDEVNTYLSDAAQWSEHRRFMEQTRAYALEPQRRTPQPQRFGASTTFMHTPLDTIWNFTTAMEGGAAAHARALNQAADVLMIDYIPAAGTDGLLMLDPGRVAADVDRMFAFRDSVPLSSQGTRPPLLLSRVGYSVHPELHNYRKTDPRYSRFIDSGYSSAQEAQSLFVENLFAALAGRSNFAGLYWWSLYDLPGIDAGPCDLYIREKLFVTGGPARWLYCTSGLSPDPDTLPRPAWDVFRTAGQQP